MAICPVCQGAAEPVCEFDGGERKDVSCPGCGNFVITNMARRFLDAHPGSRSLVSYWIRHATDGSQKPEIDEKLARAIFCEQSLPSVLQQADDLLVWMGDELLKLGTPSARISFGDQ